MKTLSWLMLVTSFALVDAQTYTTTFDATENPISEGGKWVNGKDASGLWTNCKTTGGVAKGCGNYPNWWLDATALLAGTWGPDQTVQATIWSSTSVGDGHLEAEIRLRSSLSSDNCNGYEVLFNINNTSSAYMYIVRWNGPEQDFDILKEATGTSWGVKNGDVVKATIIGNVITAYVNGVQKMQATDNVYKTGAPGMGFDENSSGGEQLFGFTDFTVSATGGATQTLTSIVITPATATVKTAATRQFSASALDQTGAAMVPQPTFTWTVSGGGTISQTALYTAGSTAGGRDTVKATAGAKNGIAIVTIGGTTEAWAAQSSRRAEPLRVRSLPLRTIAIGTSLSGIVHGAVYSGNGSCIATFETRDGKDAGISVAQPGLFFVRLDTKEVDSVRRVLVE